MLYYGETPEGLHSYQYQNLILDCIEHSIKHYHRKKKKLIVPENRHVVYIGCGKYQTYFNQQKAAKMNELYKDADLPF